MSSTSLTGGISGRKVHTQHTSNSGVDNIIVFVVRWRASGNDRFRFPARFWTPHTRRNPNKINFNKSRGSLIPALVDSPHHPPILFQHQQPQQPNCRSQQQQQLLRRLTRSSLTDELQSYHGMLEYISLAYSWGFDCIKCSFC